MPLPWLSTWKTRVKARVTKRRQPTTDAGKDASMDPIAEGSHERSVGSSSNGQSTQSTTVQLHEELAELRREIELLKATQTRTQVAPDDPARTLEVREQMEQLRLENERLRASRWAPSGSVTSPRTCQDVNRSLQEVGAEQRSEYAPSHHAYRKDQYQFPDGMSSRSVQAGDEAMGHKYVIEVPFATKSVSSSKTPRSHSLPKPSAPPGASTTRSIIHSQSIQVVREGHNPWLEDRNVTPSPPGLSSRIAQDSGEQSKSMSPQTLQALGALHMFREEKERLTADRVDNNPFSAGPDVSLRTLKALGEVASLKREIEMLKVSKVELSASSERTRQVVNQLDKVRRENEMLKANKAKELEHARRRLAYFEQNHAASSQVRGLEIKKMIITSQELDLAFLVDATGSMQSSIDMIKTTVTTMAAGLMASYPECKLRVAFVPYRDYEDMEQDDLEVCDFTSSFSGPDSIFSEALSRVYASGGGDDAEDVFSGITRVAQLSWDATNRLLIHIADAPCHGMQFHDGVGDFYPTGDKFGRKIEAQLQILYEICHISTYFFCHLNSSTRKMIRVFQAAAAGSPLTILEEQFQNISSIPHKVITLCRGTIQKTLSVMNVQQHPLDLQFVHEAVVKQVPSWSQVPIQFGVHFRCKWYRALDDMLSRINDKMALDEESMDHIQIQIAQHPFSDEGAVRWPYHASIKYPNEAPRSMVVKRFKTPLGKDVREVHKRERYWAQMEVQSVSAHMANEFNRCTSNMKNVKRVEFTQVTTLGVGYGPNIKYYNMESLLEGEWLRYSNNGGYVNTLDYAAVLQAFTHWTHERSRGLLMVTDLQGVRMTNSFGENVFCLCDPAIHCTDVLRFTRTNLGQEGFKLFFDTHKCNDVCDKLGLAPGKAGRTLSGTQVGSYW